MDLSKELKHYSARLDLWWAQRRKAGEDRFRMQSQRWEAERQRQTERERQMAAGTLPLPGGWYQHPSDPPGYSRWWDGSKWTEHTQAGSAARTSSTGNGVVIAGWITFWVGLFAWPVFIATFVLGIIACTQRRVGNGALLIVLSVIGPLVSLAGCAAVLTSGS